MWTKERRREAVEMFQTNTSQTSKYVSVGLCCIVPSDASLEMTCVVHNVPSTCYDLVFVGLL
jgi:hypothetical protein